MSDVTNEPGERLEKMPRDRELCDAMPQFMWRSARDKRRRGGYRWRVKVDGGYTLTARWWPHKTEHERWALEVTGPTGAWTSGYVASPQVALDALMELLAKSAAGPDRLTDDGRPARLPKRAREIMEQLTPPDPKSLFHCEAPALHGRRVTTRQHDARRAAEYHADWLTTLPVGWAGWNTPRTARWSGKVWVNVYSERVGGSLIESYAVER